MIEKPPSTGMAVPVTKSDAAGEVNASVERVISQNMSLLLTSIGDRRRQQLEVRRTGGTAKATPGENVTPIQNAPKYSADRLRGASS